MKHRLIKNLDFIYTCVADGRLQDAYDLERELGRGAFGTVYRAKNKVLGYRRAVKRVVKGKNNDQLPILMREIHALMDLDHPNIVKLVRYFDEGEDIYLVFELCEGPDLFDSINNALDRHPKGMKEADAADILRQMLQALKCCHNNYMGHFDVKPENFMYESKDPDAPLKMIDLGLSSGFKRDREEIRGTAAYMAPEVWDGLYGPEADIWSCGVVLFLMLTGTTLLPDASEEDIERWTHNRTWIRQRLRWARAQGLSDGAMDLLSALLRHNRHQRPTAREALWHPFLKDAGQGGTYRSRNSTLRAAADKVVDNMLSGFRAYAAEPTLKRAALLLVAHFAAYTCEESRLQRLAFMMLDRSSDGELSLEALEVFYAKTSRSIPTDLEEVFAGVDIDDDGCITYVEFLAATLPPAVKYSERIIRRVFDHLDRNRDGFIDVMDLADAFRHGHDKDKICRDTLLEVSRGSPRMSWMQFRALMNVQDELAPSSVPERPRGGCTERSRL